MKPPSNSWGCNAFYVWPIDDLKSHDIDSSNCWCHPFYDGDILVHNAMDKREMLERGGKPS